MRIFSVSTTFALVLSLAASAHAVCGDVTGDQQKTSSDALAVLRSAVGQQVSLVCDEGPSRVRLLTGLLCMTPSSSSTLSFNGFEFSSDLGSPSPYQVVDLPSINDVSGTLCGGEIEFSLEGTYNLPRNRSITAYMVVGHPDAYQAEYPVFLVLRDDAIPANAASLDSAEGLAPGEEAGVLVGTLRTRVP